MCTEKELTFSTFILYSLSDAWNKTPADVYKVLNFTGVLECMFCNVRTGYDYLIRKKY